MARPVKTVFLVRHAESAENELMQGVARSWSALTQFSLPAYVDVRSGVELASAMVRGTNDECALSANGEAQVAEVRALLLRDADTMAVLQQQQQPQQQQGVLVAHSPMLRAKATCLGLFRDLVAPACAESSFVELESLREIVPVDYYVAPARYANAQNRIAEFETWLAQRPESNIVVVGHSHYFKSMLGVDFKFANCEVWRARFDANATDPKMRWTQLTRICGSSNAKPTFGAEGPEAWTQPSATASTTSFSTTTTTTTTDDAAGLRTTMTTTTTSVIETSSPKTQSDAEAKEKR